MYGNDDSQGLFPKTHMIVDLQKQFQNLNIRVKQSEINDYRMHERRKEKSNRVSGEDRWRRHKSSKDEIASRSYSEFMGVQEMIEKKEGIREDKREQRNSP